ncbi:MAG: hypothetical protein V3U58_03855 [Thermodesulfobacteriota bacterium]
MIEWKVKNPKRFNNLAVDIKYVGAQMVSAEVEGLTLNGEPMEIGKPYELKDGDIIDGLKKNGELTTWTK